MGSDRLRSYEPWGGCGGGDTGVKYKRTWKKEKKKGTIGPYTRRKERGDAGESEKMRKV